VVVLVELVVVAELVVLAEVGADKLVVGFLATTGRRAMI
jgi:hypothetical protein